MDELMAELRTGGWFQPRPDRWRHESWPVEVETGYTMGEATLVVRWYDTQPVQTYRYRSVFGKRDLVEILHQFCAAVAKIYSDATEYESYDKLFPPTDF